MMGNCTGLHSAAETQVHTQVSRRSKLENKSNRYMPPHGISSTDPKRPKRSHGLKMKSSMSPYDNPLTSVIDGKPGETDIDWISNKVKCRPDFSSLSPNALRHVCGCFVKVETKSAASSLYIGNYQHTIFLVCNGEITIGKDKYLRGSTFGSKSLASDNKTCQENVNKGKGRATLWVMTKSIYQKSLIKFARQNNSKMNDLVKKIPAFAPLTEFQQTKVASRLKKFTFSYGQKIISQGEQGNAIFFIESGSVNVIQRSRGSSVDKVVNELSQGDYFGEASLYSNRYKCGGENAVAGNIRSADVVANSHTVVTYRLTRDEFESLLGPLHDIIRLNSATRVLNHMKAFASLSFNELETIASMLEPRFYEKDEYIFREGDIGDEMFVVGSGEIAFLKQERTRLDPLNLPYDSEELKSKDPAYDIGEYGLEVKVPDHTTKENRSNLPRQQSPKVKFIKIRQVAGKTKEEACVNGVSEIEKDIGHLFPNQYFGEGSLLTHSPRRASAKVVSDKGASLYALSGEKFRLLFGEELIKEMVEHFKKRSNADTDKKGVLIKLEDIEGIRLLGQGSYGKVTLVRHVVSGKTFALKQIMKKRVEELDQHDHINNEKMLLESINHAMVCNLIRTFKNEHSLYMLMDCVMGGELFQLLQKLGKFSSHATQFYAGQIAIVFAYLHDQCIAFRDLKPENVMIHTDGYVKVCDFGLAKNLRGGSTFTLCGTPAYAAPEVYKVEGHGTSCDWWTLGILVHELLYGSPPFRGKNANDVFNELQEYEYFYPRVQFPKGFKQHETSFVKCLLHPNPRKRLGYGKRGSKDVMKHKFFSTIDLNKLERRVYTAPHVPKIEDCYDTSNFGKRKDGFERTITPSPKNYIHEAWCARF